MPVCRYYQQGNCRFGDNCKFDHYTPQGRNDHYEQYDEPYYDNRGRSEYAQVKGGGSGGGGGVGRGGYSRSNYDNYENYDSQRGSYQQQQYQYNHDNRYSKNYVQKQDYSQDYYHQNQRQDYRQNYRQDNQNYHHHKRGEYDAYNVEQQQQRQQQYSNNNNNRYSRDYTQQERSQRSAQSPNARYNQDNQNHQNQYSSQTRSHARNQFSTSSVTSARASSPSAVDFSFNQALKSGDGFSSNTSATAGFSFNRLHDEIKQKESVSHFQRRSSQEQQMDEELQAGPQPTSASAFSFNQALANTSSAWNQPKILSGGFAAHPSGASSLSRMIYPPSSSLHSNAFPPLGQETPNSGHLSSNQQHSDHLVYSNALTEEQLLQYESSEFKFRQIPLQAPTKQLCF